MSGMMEKLKPHQRRALPYLSSGKILCGGVGTGKSITALAHYLSTQRPGTPIVVVTTAKKRDSGDWVREAEYLEMDTSLLTVISWNSIMKYTELEGCFVIFDEQRLVGKGVWVKSFKKIASKNYWILLTATPGDTWHDYLPVMVANGFFKNQTEFERNHVVFSNFTKYPKVERYLGTKRLERYRREILVMMPMERHTVRHREEVVAGYDTLKYKRVMKDRWNDWTNEPIQNASELCYTLRRVVNSDMTRLASAAALMEKHRRTIVFYNFDYELELLRGHLDENEIPYAEWNGHKHEEIPDGDRWVYLVQYAAGSEAWNCILTDTIIFYSRNYSWKVLEQCEGRIDRMNTPYRGLYYYYMTSTSSIDLAIRRAVKEKKLFNSRAFAASLAPKTA